MVTMWSSSQDLCWNLSGLLLGLLLFLGHWFGLSGGCLVVLEVHVSVDVVSTVVMEIFVIVAVTVGIWQSVAALENGLMVQVVWLLIAVVSTVWVAVMLIVVKGSIFNLVMLDTMVQVSLDVVEELIVGVLDVVDHLGSEVIL